ncbi:MAG TPA: hypothetical protein VD811_06840 [Desulfuromonadales bacterium]|nr:hypothetical protein [Desulfuromonadales bacterium]
MTSQTKTVRLKVSPGVARIVAPEAPRETKLAAARGALPLSARDLVTALFFLCHGADAEIKARALETFRGISPTALQPVLESAELHPQLLDFVVRWRISEPALIGPLLDHPGLAAATLRHLAGHAGVAILSLLADNQRCCDDPEVVAALLANPHTSEGIRARLTPVGDSAVGGESTEAEADPTAAGESEGGDGEDEEEAVEEELNLSKYQMALEMGVSDKIKMALTGDKEWRNIFLKDPNKLVSSAVLKNPRITEGEVLAVAKNKSSSDELIRLITLNREWVKHYEIKKALVMHPRTPLPKALRYMTILTEKDIKNLAKSRGVSQVIVNNARRMLLTKQR